MDQAFLDYYSLEPFTQWIHRTLCGVMPEDWAVFIEGLALGIVILLAYAVLAVVLIYMERRVCGAFQCRIGPSAGRRVEDTDQGDHTPQEVRPCAL